MDKTEELTNRSFYWPDLQADVRRYIRSCDACQRNKPSNRRPGGLLQPIPIPQERWEQITMDLIAGLPKTARGNSGIAVFVDRLSKEIKIAPISDDTTAPAIARVYFDNVFRHKGLSRVIISDRDPRFTSNFWRSLFRLLGTKLSFSTAFHPQTDGQTERVNRVIEEALRPYVNARHSDWDLYLTPIEFAYNNSVQLSTGHSPFYLNTGRHPLTPSNLLKPPTSDTPAADQFLHNIAYSLQHAKTLLALAQNRQKTGQASPISDWVRHDEAAVWMPLPIDDPLKPRKLAVLQRAHGFDPKAEGTILADPDVGVLFMLKLSEPDKAGRAQKLLQRMQFFEGIINMTSAELDMIEGKGRGKRLRRSQAPRGLSELRDIDALLTIVFRLNDMSGTCREQAARLAELLRGGETSGDVVPKTDGSKAEFLESKKEVVAGSLSGVDRQRKRKRSTPVPARSTEGLELVSLDDSIVFEGEKVPRRRVRMAYDVLRGEARVLESAVDSLETGSASGSIDRLLKGVRGLASKA
ncbi:putative retrotransposon protein [Klebsormidium nitens]|uniref:Putative retrotransposon protein n=1 Tax=Klebsormidium nitens TaxID=105231 RepID=A0A1Y1IL52_KLENI|nr:putative retrotransposon protein [Klebsormidium nitens]|eukprot:GAQ89367.1 putative retrotransposon protein [Klebsormidium nitens]